MYSISDEQVDYILNDISARGIKTEDLQQNILDHVCCIIEQELEVNGDFSRFYLQTIERFYKKELCEIEEETLLLLTFKNYYTMKKVMIASGAVTATTLLLGSFFKVMHWPGAALFYFLGVITVSFIFLPLLSVIKSKELNAGPEKIILVVGVAAAILYCVSTFLHIQHLPGARSMILASICLSFFVFAPIYFFTGIRKPEKRLNTIVFTILLITATAMQYSIV